MKNNIIFAQPLVTNDGRQEYCDPEICDSLMFITPYSGTVILPVYQGDKQREADGPIWWWNGDMNKPSLKPSVLSRREGIRDHYIVMNGKVKYLDDSTHHLVGRTVNLEAIRED